MSTSRAAFLQAICENPDDDTPRLVYADWLDEHGDPDRAEFVRLQIGLAAGTVPADRRAEATARAAELLGRNQAAWWAELPRPAGAAWLPAVFAAAPVAAVRCGGTFTERTGRPLFASPLLGRLAHFSAPPLGPDGAEALADNPHLVGRLRTLDVGCPGDDGDRVAATLSRAAGLRNLESLTFHGVGAAGVAALAGSGVVPRLRALHLHGNPVGDDGAAALAASPHLGALELLLLNGAGVGDRGAAALARSEHLAALRQLYLGDGNPISDAGAVAVAAAAGLPRLAELHLWGTRVGEAGARALADFAERRGLRVLNLRSCPVPQALAQEIARRLGPRFAI